MMFPFIAIPSYKRSDTIASKTLKFLHLSGYPASRIHIFVADDDEYAKYRDALDEDLYGEIILGRRGIKEQRNFINSFYKEDEIIIQMDDDVRDIKSALPFLTLVDLGLSSLEYRTAGLWGIMPNDDGRKMKDVTTDHLSFIIGCFFMIRNHKSIVLTQDEKEDYELSILYFIKYGKVLRYQGAGVSTSYQKGKGGLQETDRIKRMSDAVDALVKKYPEYCSRKDKKGTADLLLNWRSPAPKFERQPSTRVITPTE